MIFLVDPPRNRSLPPGYDEEDPYAGDDLEEYPDWWRKNIELFREYGLRPYRPAQFTDGEFSPEVTARLEDKYGISIHLRGIDVDEGDSWEIRVDDETIGTVDRHRTGDAYTVYDISSDQFEKLVEGHLG